MKSLRITCFIDSLGAGGAQRQLCTLAVLLKRSGADVSIITYHSNDFFLPIIENEGIKHSCIGNGSRTKRFIDIRAALQNRNHDVVLAFLPAPSIYAELSGLPKRKWGLVVSERSAVPGNHSASFQWKRLLHQTADYVCTNSHTNRLMIEHAVPKLSGRVVTIYNAIDFDTFYPRPTDFRKTGTNKIVVVASHQQNKNLLGLIEAISITRKKYGSTDVVIDWYGEIHPDSDPYDKGLQVIQERGLGNCFHFYPANESIAEIYNKADAVGLFSYYEGLPNVVCEAMACGCPILLSNVSDATNLVKEGVNGFLFDPRSPNEIADAIMKFIRLKSVAREIMSKKSREMAEHMFSPDEIVNRYLTILDAAAAHKKISIQHWIPNLPESAFKTLGVNRA
jgi:glycosyltransferase involved in cell wall biosynthesis